MDPDVNLAAQLQIADRILEGEDSDADLIELATLVIALNDWIVRGGCLPTKWAEALPKALDV